MTKRIITTTEGAGRVRTTSAGAGRVDREHVRLALGAERVATGSQARSPSLLASLRRELSTSLRSSGGRPGLEGAARRQKIPMTDADWSTLEQIAEKLGAGAEGVTATPGQVAAQLLSRAIAAFTGDHVTYRHGGDATENLPVAENTHRRTRLSPSVAETPSPTRRATVNVRPRKLPGRWRDGYALDVHTLSSTYLGDDDIGRAQFDTTRSNIGDLLYRLKHDSDASAVTPIVDAVAAFVASWKPAVDLIVPVPPSRPRAFPPVLVLGAALAKRLNLPFAPSSVTWAREVSELGNAHDYDARTRLLAGAFTLDKAQVKGRRVLLFDDLHRSGATLNTLAAALYDEGAAADVVALAITRTR